MRDGSMSARKLNVDQFLKQMSTSRIEGKSVKTELFCLMILLDNSHASSESMMRSQQVTEFSDQSVEIADNFDDSIDSSDETDNEEETKTRFASTDSGCECNSDEIEQLKEDVKDLKMLVQLYFRRKIASLEVVNEDTFDALVDRLSRYQN